MTRLGNSTDSAHRFGYASALASTDLRPLCDSMERAPSVPSSLAAMRSPAAQSQAVLLTATKILIIDDCTLQRESLATILGKNGMSSPVFAWDLSSICLALDEMPPDIVLLSIATRDKFALLRTLRENCPRAKVIVMGIAEDAETDIVACAEAGIAGYHLRTDSLGDLLDMIVKVSSGEPACSPRVSAILLTRLSALAAQHRPAPRGLVLTSREIQILRMLETGLSNRDIADRLCITLHTVKNHVHSVLSKLGVSTRAEAAALFRSSQWAQ